MIKLSIYDNAGQGTSAIVNLNSTLRQALDDAHINYAGARPMINGEQFSSQALDKTFTELGISSDCIVALVVPKNNA